MIQSLGFFVIMNYYVYILFSKSLNRYYVGSTILDVQERLERHLTDFYGATKYTHKARDWELVHVLECESLIQARKVERHIKRMKSKVYIHDLISIPGFSESVILKFKEAQD